MINRCAASNSVLPGEALPASSASSPLLSAVERRNPIMASTQSDSSRPASPTEHVPCNLLAASFRTLRKSLTGSRPPRTALEPVSLAWAAAACCSLRVGASL